MWSPIPGNKHPWALGRDAREVWPEIWETIGPLFENVTTTGQATYSEDSLLLMHRHGYTEECYFNFTFSPIRGESGRVEGVFNAVMETTNKVIGERRQRTLTTLAAATKDAKTVEAALIDSGRILSLNTPDVPFALLYKVEGDTLRLVEASSFLRGTSFFTNSFRLGSGGSPWFDVAVDTGEPQLLEDVDVRLDGTRLSKALVLPLTLPSQSRPTAILVAGVSPQRALDPEYRNFYDLMGGYITTAVANARMFEEEKRRAEALAELDRAKTAFFSNVSHEFRTPLTLMLGPLEESVATKHPLQMEDTALVHRNGLRLLKLVNSLLDFARIEAGRVQASYEPLDLSTFTADLASAFRSVIEKAGMRLVVTAPQLSERVYVDRDMWEKIVLNLLSNAFKYTFEGEVTVSLWERGHAVELVVRDTGVGIPETEIPHLFERFHRVEGSKGRTHEGTGIGLALVHELVKLHGGTIGVESVLGRGTTFTVTIPKGSEHLPRERISGERTLASTALRADAYVEEALRWLPEDAGTTAPVGESDSPTSGFPGVERHEVTARSRLLLADDNADMRAYVRRLLSDRYEVEAVADGEAALAAIRENVPDLVVTDVMMPKLDGFGLLRELRDDPKTRTLPVILLSARAGEEARIEGLGAGAADYLTKPFSARELLARVAAQLELARVRREAEAEIGAALRRERGARAEAETERKRLRELFVSAPAAIALLRGPEHSFEFVNAVYCMTVGRSEEQLLGRPIREALPEIAGQGYFELLDGVYQTGKPHSDAESRALLDRRGDGKLDEAFYTFTYQAWRNEHGGVDGVVVFALEVTETVLARRGVEEASESLREADRRKDEFLAMLAHELRNPLAPMMTASQLLRGRVGDRMELKRPLEVVARQTEHLTRLVDDLLEVSRITRGKIRLEKEPLDASVAVSRAVEISRPLIDSKRHNLSVALPHESLWISADPTRLSQALANLLNNAAKYTDQGGRIWLTLDREGEQVVFRVRDSGVGISKEVLPKLFDLFTQAETTLDRSQGGLGIGLTLVRGLIELHGGTVEALSEGPGKGSEFVVRIPALVEKVKVPDQTGDFGALSKVPPCRIVVVDDNVDAGDSLAELLSESGHEVRVAYDGFSALDLVRVHKPNVVLLDIGLPKMDGYEVARKLRDAHGNGLVLVALTGYGQQEDQRRSKEAGFDFHIVKPPTPQALQTVLTATCGRPEQANVVDPRRLTG
jgi:PAS domain S-box-containing protein